MTTKTTGLDLVKLVQKFENGEKMTTQECTDYLLLLKILGTYEDDAKKVLRDHAPAEGRTYESARGIAQVGKSTEEKFDSAQLKAKYPEAYQEAVKAQDAAGKLTVSEKFVECKSIAQACTIVRDCTAKVTVKATV